jgi:hypothetical protein
MSSGFVSATLRYNSAPWEKASAIKGYQATSWLPYAGRPARAQKPIENQAAVKSKGAYGRLEWRGARECLRPRIAAGSLHPPLRLILFKARSYPTSLTRSANLRVIANTPKAFRKGCLDAHHRRDSGDGVGGGSRTRMTGPSMTSRRF